MVIYKLGILNDRTFDLSNIIEMDAKNSLRILDKFTSMFNSEEDLKQYLLNKNIINYKEYYQKINIVYQYNRSTKTLPVIYSSEKEYLNSAIILNKLYSYICNLKFVQKLINYYDYNIENNPQIENISNLRLYLSDLKRDGKKAFNYDKRLLDYTLNNILVVATHKYDKKTNSYKYNYRGLRDLGMFIYNFDKLEELNKIKNTIEENIKDDVEIKNDKWILSSEGDPDFPFNSEEEKQYLLEQEKELEEYEKRLKKERGDL